MVEHDIEEESPEQYSQASRQALAEATARLVTELRAWADATATMHGGSSEMAGLFERNAILQRVVAEWTDDASDHTGTWPFVLLDRDEDDDEDEDDLSDEDETQAADSLSVVSRWDLAITDPAALLQAGRAAHRRNRPEETDADTAAAVTRPSDAVYAVLHEAGEPLLDIPGIEPLQAARWYVTLNGPPEPMNAVPTAEDLTPPPGDLTRGERW